jgi:hypothetical protein
MWINGFFFLGRYPNESSAAGALSELLGDGKMPVRFPAKDHCRLRQLTGHFLFRARNSGVTFLPARLVPAALPFLSRDCEGVPHGPAGHPGG